MSSRLVRQTRLAAGIAAAAMLFTNSANAAIVFSFDYSDNAANVGFLDPTLGAQRQAALTTAGTLFSNLFGQSFSNSATLTFSVTSNVNPASTTIASAGTQTTDAPGFGANEVIRNKLLGNGDINGAAADGTVNVNFFYNFQLDPNIPASATQFDFYATLFHEFTHAVGFGSEINADGTTTGAFSKWDQFLTDGAGNPVVDPTTLTVNNLAYASAQAADPRFAGANAIAAYGSSVPLFANPDLSHLDETTFSTPVAPENYLMKPSRDTGPLEARFYHPVEIGILTDIGYTPNATAVPEPWSIALVLVGMAGTMVLRRKA